LRSIGCIIHVLDIKKKNSGTLEELNTSPQVKAILVHETGNLNVLARDSSDMLIKISLYDYQLINHESRKQEECFQSHGDCGWKG
jgi:hypothetical protein